MIYDTLAACADLTARPRSPSITPPLEELKDEDDCKSSVKSEDAAKPVANDEGMSEISHSSSSNVGNCGGSSVNDSSEYEEVEIETSSDEDKVIEDPYISA